VSIPNLVLTYSWSLFISWDSERLGTNGHSKRVLNPNVGRRYNLTTPPFVNLLVSPIEGGSVLWPRYEEEDDVRRPERIDNWSLKASSQVCGQSGYVRISRLSDEVLVDDERVSTFVRLRDLSPIDILGGILGPELLARDLDAIVGIQEDDWA
jgi:hypothetical protein